jgi:hypothetical protein
MRALPYATFMPLEPPRGTDKVSKLSYWEKKGWIAQLKKNGTNNVVYIAPNKKISCLTRHKTPHKAWQPNSESLNIYKGLPGKGWWVFNEELLHSKGPLIKDTHFIFDILVADGKFLQGTTYEQRYQMLLDLFPARSEGSDGHYVLNRNTWLAKNMTSGFQATFDGLTHPLDEGLVLKNPKGKLLLKDNSNWIIRCRKGTKNYDF